MWDREAYGTLDETAAAEVEALHAACVAAAEAIGSRVDAAAGALAAGGLEAGDVLAEAAMVADRAEAFGLVRAGLRAFIAHRVIDGEPHGAIAALAAAADLVEVALAFDDPATERERPEMVAGMRHMIADEGCPLGSVEDLPFFFFAAFTTAAHRPGMGIEMAADVQRRGLAQLAAEGEPETFSQSPTAADEGGTGVGGYL